jgi:hypothetical protein
MPTTSASPAPVASSEITATAPTPGASRWRAGEIGLDLHKAKHALPLGVGILAMAVMLARTFGKFYGGLWAERTDVARLSCADQDVLAARDDRPDLGFPSVGTAKRLPNHRRTSG